MRRRPESDSKNRIWANLKPIMRRRPPAKPLISSQGLIPPDSILPAPNDRSPAQAFIGSTLVVKGEVSGDQDLIIEGRIEGPLSLPGHGITVGRNGQIMGDLTAQLIRIEGFVEGNLQGEEKIILCRSANVRGHLIAPRVVLEEGCWFKGGIRMMAGEEPAPEEPGRGSAPGRPETLRA